VLWRFKAVVIPGIVLGIVLATLSFVKVGSAGISYRHSETWVSHTTLFVTQSGFPWGSLSGAPTARQNAVSADPGRLSALALIYANIADSDVVRQRVVQTGGADGTIEAAALPASASGNDVLPIL